MVVSGRWLAIAVMLLGMLGACSSSEDGDGDDGDDSSSSAGDNGGGAGNGTTAVGNELDSAILFSPMYSAFDGVHEFRLPAIVNGYTGVTWEIEDDSLADLAPNGDNGVMITTKAAGTTRIIARSGPLSGSAMLTITEATPADWELGEQRYNNGVPLPTIDPSMVTAAGFTIPDDLSCRNCHGGGAEALSVEHTPQQTAGYSDQDLVNIFTMGQKPPTANWRSGIPMFFYTMLHTWAATPEEQRGIVTYLRSLEPKAQGEIDFGGLVNRSADAGM
jgi:hypothetical protein